MKDILSQEQSSIFTDHDATLHDFTAFIKAPRKYVGTI